MQLFLEWDAIGRAIEAADGMTDDDLDAACDEQRAICDRMMPLPARTAPEFAAKFIAITDHGDFGLDHCKLPFVAEASELAGVSIPRNSLVLNRG